jgi:phage tail protein X
MLITQIINLYLHLTIKTNKMEFKGTQGEWSQSHRKTDRDGNYSTEVYCNKGDTIATLSWYTNTEVKGVVSTYREANAKLIAASPELLKALQLVTGELFQAIECINGLESAKLSATIKKANEAINKALK